MCNNNNEAREAKPWSGWRRTAVGTEGEDSGSNVLNKVEVGVKEGGVRCLHTYICIDFWDVLGHSSISVSAQHLGDAAVVMFAPLY